jgi:hypothetical protein
MGRKITYQTAVPFGDYETKFLGLEDVDTSRWKDTDGKPKLQLIFEVLSGFERGQRILQIVGSEARPGSPLARIMNGMSGGTLVRGQAVDMDQFIGRRFTVRWNENPKSPNANGHIEEVWPLDPASSAALQVTDASAASTSAPPPGDKSSSLDELFDPSLNQKLPF